MSDIGFISLMCSTQKHQERWKTKTFFFVRIQSWVTHVLFSIAYRLCFNGFDVRLMRTKKSYSGKCNSSGSSSGLPTQMMSHTLQFLLLGARSKLHQMSINYDMDHHPTIAPISKPSDSLRLQISFSSLYCMFSFWVLALILVPYLIGYLYL